jgi:hypothetical protein
MRFEDARGYSSSPPATDAKEWLSRVADYVCTMMRR